MSQSPVFTYCTILLVLTASGLTCFFFSSLNQLGKVNELLIKPDLSDLTGEKEEEDVVEEDVEEENGSGADCVYKVTNIEAALNLVIIYFQHRVTDLLSLIQFWLK